MTGIKREGVPVLAATGNKTETVLGAETQFKGNLNSSGILRIEGKIEGEIVHEGDLIIGENGVVTAKIRANRVHIAGNLNGDVDCTGRVELMATARMRGDIKAGELVVAEGATLNGTVDMKANEKTVEARVLRTA